MRRILRLKSRKEDPGLYINPNNEKLASTFEEFAGYIAGGVRWVKRIIYANDENSSLPAWITQSTFYAKPQKINRVHKRKLPQHLEESLDLISKGMTPTNLALQRMKHQKIVQQRNRVQAIQAALQRRRVLEQQEYDKPKKLIQRFTISYVEDKLRTNEQDFIDKKITLALDLLRQQIDKKHLNHYQEKKRIQPIVHTKPTNTTLKLAQSDKKEEKQQNTKLSVQNNIQIEKPAISPIQSLIKQSSKEDILSKNNNPFIGGISRNIILSQLINNSSPSPQLFNSGHLIEQKRQEQLSINNNQNHQANQKTNLFNRSDAPNTRNNQYQLSNIPEESSASSYSLPQNHMISNNIYGNRNISFPQYTHQNHQQNIQPNSISFNNQNSFTNSVNPDLLANGSALNYFQSSKNNEPSLFNFENRSQGSSKTHKKYAPTQKKLNGHKPK